VSRAQDIGDGYGRTVVTGVGVTAQRRRAVLIQVGDSVGDLSVRAGGVGDYHDLTDS
jgi:hypothetical protein